MLRFSVTLYGESEHDERNEAQKLWHALDKCHGKAGRPVVAMLVGEADYAEPPGPKQRETGIMVPQ